MFKVFIVVFLIFGTIVGSGFSSGMEIVVFFSRFGNWSYLFIVLACVLFFGVTYFFLKFGAKIVEKLESSKILNVIIVALSLVFAASMFAGMESLFSYFPRWLYALTVAVMLIVSVWAVCRGVSGLEKANFVLVPLLSAVFFVLLCVLAQNEKQIDVQFSNVWAGVLYSPLFVALNSSMGSIVISKAGVGLTKKQTVLSSLFSSLLIFVFLTLGNFVLLKCPESFSSDMPLLYLSQNNSFLFVLSYVVILLGCLTSVVSMCYTLKLSLEKIVRHNFCSSCLAVFLPFLVSGVGFSQIVVYLYPLCSVFGIFVLVFFLVETGRSR